MLTLTQIFLHNWHRFYHHLIPVEDSLYLAGHNGSGKSSILDAMQVVLIGDGNRVRFNSSAQERSHRNLDSYVRGKLGEQRWLRPGNTVAYIALEFSDRENRLNQTTLGVCIESNESKTERTFFIIDGGIDPDRFMCEEHGRTRELTRRELRQAFRNTRKARHFDQVSEYQVEMRNSLGGLNERFFDLFLRALTFQPMRDIREFVERWLLEERGLEIDTFQQTVERFSQLKREADIVAEKLEQLRHIVNEQAEVLRLRNLHDAYKLLLVLLQAEDARRQHEHLLAQQQEQEHQLAARQSEHEQAQAALTGANEALLTARIQLQQSDVVRRRNEIQQQIQEATRQADEIVRRRTALWHDLQHEVQLLAPLSTIETPHLPAAEQQTLHNLIQIVTALTPDQPPPATLHTTIDAAIQVLDTALERVRKPLYELEHQQEELKKRQQQRQKQLAQLQKGKSSYPPEVERVRTMLERLVRTRPRLLCELLEIPDERWQNAVEAMLGRRRFNIIVPPRWFTRALRELDRLRIEEQIYGVGLIDLERARQESKPARPGSLAEQITFNTTDLQGLLEGYINTVLGNIMCCETVDDLRQHARSITPDVVLYSEWTAQALHPRTYQPRFVGKRAIQSQIEACQQELRELDTQLQAGSTALQDLHALAALLNRGRTFSNLRQHLDAPLDDGDLRAAIAEWQADLAALDMSGVQELEREVQRLEAIASREAQQERGLYEQIVRLQNQLDMTNDLLRTATQQRTEREQQVKEEEFQLPHAQQEATRLLNEQLQTPDLNLQDAMRNTETARNRFNTQAGNTTQRLTQAATAYNISYQFAGIAGDPNEQRYADELQRLDETELPRYSTQIAQAQHEAEEELREHVLHRLREHIGHARDELARINDALRTIDFHGERYRFRSFPAEDVREYYDLITDTSTLGSGSLYDSDFYVKHKPTFDRFYELLTRQPQTDGERREQQRMTDYRCYLDYDIDVTHADGQVSRLSRIMGQTSGGETQTPFYVTIAASFAQLYHINDYHSRPTIRLVAFDEAFSKMDQDRIGATLELLQNFGLQIITATPLERCEYLVPYVCTSLVLTVVKNTVIIEPYRNYAARLTSFNQRRDGVEV